MVLDLGKFDEESMKGFVPSVRVRANRDPR